MRARGSTAISPAERDNHGPMHLMTVLREGTSRPPAFTSTTPRWFEFTTTARDPEG
jgi:hypothetical protein